MQRMATVVLKSFNFEVFGKVQGVFFRKNTIKKAEELGLVGWVMNTSHNTVVGVAQGSEDKLQVMKHWLSCVGSKASKIERCEVKNERTLTKTEYTSFTKRYEKR